MYSENNKRFNESQEQKAVAIYNDFERAGANNLLSLQEASNLCSLSIQTLRRAIIERELKCLKPRGKYLVSLRELSNFLAGASAE